MVAKAMMKQLWKTRTFLLQVRVVFCCLGSQQAASTQGWWPSFWPWMQYEQRDTWKKKRLLYGLSLSRTYILEEILLGLETLRLGIKLSVRILCIWPSHLSFTAVTAVDSRELNRAQLPLYLEVPGRGRFQETPLPAFSRGTSMFANPRAQMDFVSIWVCPCRCTSLSDPSV